MNFLRELLALEGFAWPWILLAIPLPWLVHALLPARGGGDAALRVPWGDRLQRIASAGLSPGSKFAVRYEIKEILGEIRNVGMANEFVAAANAAINHALKEKTVVDSLALVATKRLKFFYSDLNLRCSRSGTRQRFAGVARALRRKPGGFRYDAISNARL